MGQLCEVVDFVHISDLDAKVRDVWNGSIWNFDVLATLLFEEIRERLSRITIPSEEDRVDG